ncbi:LLM class flavin-dependent oxidoreductase [Pseudoalteromonas rubra]|uniref:LLM class flavin-dependent oxidoreductase n=1 Tax=Pseudoalteromonas rubra TaxID=43658 RepID=UPI000F7A4FDD|nr:LLM class flavin-dependent oxidoreductase [Pseudoalteromonas rubra]
MTNVTTNSARFLWSIPVGGGQKAASDARNFGFDLEEMIQYAQRAEALGIEQLLLGVGFHCPDPIAFIGSLIRSTKRIKFLLAYRAGSISPTTFVQMINTLSALGDDRVSLNMLAGISPIEQKYYGDHLEKSHRQQRLDEFITICERFWLDSCPVDHKGPHYHIEQGQLVIGYSNSKRHAPEMFISGNSATSMQSAMKHKACWLRYSDTVDKVAADIKEAVAEGVEVGIRMSLIIRQTREEAQLKISEMMNGADAEWAGVIEGFVKTCDSQAVKSVFDIATQAQDDWADDYIWTGAVPFRGGPALALVGTPQEVADYIMRYKSAGVSVFLFSGWPQLDEMERFTTQVIPLIRAQEAQLSAAPLLEIDHVAEVDHG